MSADPILIPPPHPPTHVPPRAVPTPDRLTRGEFLDMFAAEYGSGQHVTFLGPTQRGKTTLSHQMLAQVISPEMRVHMLATKPKGRDPVMAKAAERLNLRIVSEWPPNYNYKDRQRNGYIIQPDHDMHDHKKTTANLKLHSAAAINDSYASKRPVILDLDETHIIQNQLKLKDEIESPLMRGAPVCGVWCLIQRGYYITYLAYCSPEWMLIYYDPDQANQRRYGEIGGVDPKGVAQLVSNLKTHRGDDGKSTVSEVLCVKRSGPELFIVETS